jgi:hypothetical protein
MALQRSALWAVALTAVALALPTPANAGETPFLDEDLATYFGIAHEHWGGPIPTCVANGVTTVPVHAVLYDDPDPSVAARAEQPGCRLWVDRGNWRRLAPVEACTIVVHEWGHMLGHGHSDDPDDLMAAFPRRPPRACAALERRPRGARASSRRARSCAARAHVRTACARRIG